MRTGSTGRVSTPPRGARRSVILIVVAVLLAAAITGGLVAAGRVITPNFGASLFGQTYYNAMSLKSLLATVTLGLAAVQVVLALWMYGKLPGARNPPRSVAIAHRVNGVVLIAVTLPVAVHCLIAYGVQFTSLRVAVHSLFGCFLYGAFAAKVLLVQSKRLPGWVLPVAGGTLAVTVVVIWYTSALWYYNGFALPG